MKLLILLMLISVSCFAQNEPRLVEISKEWPVKKVMASDGLVYKYNLPTDSARRFDPGDGEYEVTVSFKKIGVDPPDPVTETIDSEAITYEGWARHGATSDPSWYAGTISYSSVGQAMYTFTGTGIEIHGETGPNHGTGTVSIGTQSKTVSWQSDGRKLPAKVVEFKGLPRGQHTVVIKPNTGTILIDFLIIVK